MSAEITTFSLSIRTHYYAVISTDVYFRRIQQSTAMLNFFDATKFKLDRTLNTIDGSMSKPSHLFEKNIEENVDKQVCDNIVVEMFLLWLS